MKLGKQFLAVSACAKILLLLFVSSYVQQSLTDEIHERFHDDHNPPHVVVLYADDMGFNDIGYQSTDLSFTTPFLDSLAADGVILSRYYTSQVCTPSRGSLMTGRYAIHTGLQTWFITSDNLFGLPTDLKILPNLLSEKGYKTVLVGKWHLGHFNENYLPNNRGFDHFYGYYAGYIDYWHHQAEQMACDGDDCYTDFHNEEENVYGLDNVFTTYALADEADEVINTHDSETPLFLYYALPNPHSPLEVPAKFLAENEELLSSIPNKHRRLFAALVMILDQTAERLVNTLKKKGMWENTVFIFASDNGADITHKGGGNNYPLRGAKGFLWEGGVRVPAFVYSPLLSESNRGKTYTDYFHVSDWLPTIVNGIVGGNDLDVETAVDGINLWPSLLGKSNRKREEVLININGANVFAMGDESMLRDQDKQEGALIMGDWKLVRNQIKQGVFMPPECFGEGNDTDCVVLDEGGTYTKEVFGTYLFNITADPSETNDLKSEYREIFEYMMKRLQFHSDSQVQPLFCPAPDTNSRTYWDANDGFICPWKDDETPCQYDDSDSDSNFDSESDYSYSYGDDNYDASDSDIFF